MFSGALGSQVGFNTFSQDIFNITYRGNIKYQIEPLGNISFYGLYEYIDGARTADVTDANEHYINNIDGTVSFRAYYRNGLQSGYFWVIITLQ